MELERFTDSGLRVMRYAHREAKRLQQCIGTEHILLALLEKGDAVSSNLLTQLGLNVSQVRQEVQRLAMSKPLRSDTLPPEYTPAALRVITLAGEEARLLMHDYTGTDHVLLAVLQVPDCSAAQILAGLGLDLAAVRDGVLRLLGADAQAIGDLPVPREGKSLPLARWARLKLPFGEAGA